MEFQRSHQSAASPITLDSFLSSGRHHPFLTRQACKIRLTFPSLSRWPQFIIGLAKKFVQDFGNTLQKNLNELFGQPDMSEKIKVQMPHVPQHFSTSPQRVFVVIS